MDEHSHKALNIIMTLDGGQGRDVVDAAISIGREHRLFSLGDATPSPFGLLAAAAEIQPTHAEAWFIACRIDEDVEAFRSSKLPEIALASVTHRTAYVSEFATLGENVFIGAMAVVNPQARIGDFVFVNAGSVIEHDCSIGDGTTLGPGVRFPGFVSIGQRCAIGAGVVARPGARVVDDCTIGAGAVIARDITEPGVYVGNPARRLMKAGN